MTLLVECAGCGIESGAERDEYGRLLVKPCRGCIELALLAQVPMANAVRSAADELAKLRAVAEAALALANTPELCGLCDEGDELKQALRDAGVMEE